MSVSIEAVIQKIEGILKDENTLDLNHQQLLSLSKKAILGNKDVSALFQVNNRTLYTWRKYKGLRYFTVSTTGRVYYMWPDIVAFLEKMNKINRP